MNGIQLKVEFDNIIKNNCQNEIRIVNIIYILYQMQLILMKYLKILMDFIMIQM